LFLNNALCITLNYRIQSDEDLSHPSIPSSLLFALTLLLLLFLFLFLYVLPPIH
jgi:hypothetical protein